MPKTNTYFLAKIMLSSRLPSSNMKRCVLPNTKKAISAIATRTYSGNSDIPTHTGQVLDDGDYRLARFQNAQKQVNPNWAVHLIARVPPKEVSQRVVWCDGGSGPEGHPRVYINLDKPGEHSCGYCGLRFVHKGH